MNWLDRITLVVEVTSEEAHAAHREVRSSSQVET